MAEEEITKAYQSPTSDMSDTKLVEIADAWITESKKYHSELEKLWKTNEAYYQGNQTERDKIPSWKSDTVQNHIFMGVETIVPIITANSPQFIVEPPEESDQAVKYADSVQAVVSILWELLGIRNSGEMLVRHMVIYRLGCWKVLWNDVDDQPMLKYVRPQRLYFPKVSGRLPYMIEKIDVTAEEFRELWGDEKFKEFLKVAGVDFDEENGNLADISGLWSIWEVHTKEMTFWKYGEMIIDKEANRTYDFESKDKNHFAQPKIPYILASAFRLGDSPVGNTDLIQQTIPIQDIINTTTRIIINNARKMGNATWLIDSDTMTYEEATTKITDEEGLIIYGSGVANQNNIRRDAPPPIPEYIIHLKTMAEQAFDNIFGTHSTTRGERGSPETATGRMLLKQADLGRVDLLVREFERVVEEAGNWLVQLMKVNYNSKKTFRRYGESGQIFVTLEPHMIQSGLKLVVKSGTTLPTDQVSKRNEAIELWGLAALDPVTLYERLKFPNPEETAKRLQLWKQGQLEMEASIKGNTPQAPQKSAKPPFANPLGNRGALQANPGAGAPI